MKRIEPITTQLEPAPLPYSDAPEITAVNAEEYKINVWTAEASALLIRPGVVPRTLPTKLGNGQPFLMVHAGKDRWLYRQGNGCLELIVWND